MHPNEHRVEQLRSSADRYDSFAETAELMGDSDGSDRFREMAIQRRMTAMSLLDERLDDARCDDALLDRKWSDRGSFDRGAVDREGFDREGVDREGFDDYR